ncbi:IS66 family transposase [Exilibacterium tricleocarpae]|uniref:IS66 family transposase n=1 Tax=Exilibacterium tricleocarpae TaxID=2591008 RepID=A0A545SKT9_9GAMM|nr:IS66 family transposase [Exilibacterium tricleocarpae]
MREENGRLKQRVAWFERQVFGQKSEKRSVENPHQGSLLGSTVKTKPVAEDKVRVSYLRGKAKKRRPGDCATDAGLRFSEDVPVEIVKVTPPELSGDDADQYEVIDTKVSHKLAQRPASYVVLQYEIPVFKRKDALTTGGNSSALVTTAMPDQVFDGSIADVSVLVGLLVDKFCYHLPLHRQHQRMAQAGVTLARSTLTNWIRRSIELLRPVVEAQLQHVLHSKILAMDETPIKAGKKHKGKMQQAYFWPIYGDDHEVVFTFSNSRARKHIEQVIGKSFEGTLLTDGYAAYARYAQQSEGVTHAQCWVHTRRKLIEAEESDPEAVSEALEMIARLYQVEKHIRIQSLQSEDKRQCRLNSSKPVVDEFFAWCTAQCHRVELTPTHPLSKALRYALNREQALRVFLEDPDLPMDTNHLEREIRPVPLGRRNWLFCWTELGAEHVGIIQSLISTCKLQGVNPHAYLTDVLQRVAIHPSSRVTELTPRVWRERYAGNPMKSVLDRSTPLCQLDAPQRSHYAH